MSKTQKERSEIVNIGNLIRSFRQKNRMTLKELAGSANISISYLGDIEKGRSKPSIETLLKLAKALKTTPGYLLNEDFMMVSEDNNFLTPFMANVPVLKDYEENDFKYADSKTESYQTVVIDDPKQISGIFFFRVRDNSMKGSRINKNDFVLVKKQDYADTGSVFLIWLPPNDILLRRVYKDGDNIILQSDNPDVKPVIVYSPGDLKVIGKVIKVMFDME